MNAMNLSLYRRIHVLPGMRLNIGTRAVSLSFGHRGCWYTLGAHGRRTATLGWPGPRRWYAGKAAGRSSILVHPRPAPSVIWSLALMAGLLFTFRLAWAIGDALAR